MQKQESSIMCSYVQIETQSSISGINYSRKNNGPRFQRSRSGQRSKSKQSIDNNNTKLNFYVRNIFTNQQKSPIKNNNNILSQNLLKIQHLNKIQMSPIKSIKRRNNHLNGFKDMEQSQKQLIEHLQKRCQELNLLLEKSQTYIIELQSKIYQLEQKNNKKNQDYNLLLKRPQNQLIKTQRQHKGNNLAKLRKQIAQSKTVQIIPNDILTQKIGILQSENLFLKEEIKTLKISLQKYEDMQNRIRSQKQNQLQKLLEKLRTKLKESQKRQDQLILQIGMLRLRQSRQSDNKQQAKSQQLIYLRYRYEKMRKKYEQVRIALQTLQDKQQRTNYLISDKREQGEVSLQLTP